MLTILRQYKIPQIENNTKTILRITKTILRITKTILRNSKTILKKYTKY